MASRRDSLTKHRKELIFLILHYLKDEKFKDTVHKLERESRVFFNMKHFEEMVIDGKWDEVERYLSAFTEFLDNRYSMKIFFEIRKQKYLEALDEGDRVKALDILLKELKVFSQYDEGLFKEITHLLALDNIRQNKQLSTYTDAKAARTRVMSELKRLIESNPVFHDKLQFPSIEGRFQTLLDQSLDLQHSLCKNPTQNPDPDTRTLFVDHKCTQSNNSFLPTASDQPMGPALEVEGLVPMSGNGPFQPTPAPAPAPAPAPVQTSFKTWKLPWLSLSTDFGGTIYRCALINSAPILKGHAGSDDASKTKPVPILGRTVLPETNPGQSHSPAFNMVDGLPKTVARTLNQGSAPISMDFHPIRQTLLLVGTHVGDIGLWEVCSGEKLVSKSFKIWNIEAISMTLKEALTQDSHVSVNRIIWSPSGTLFGIAYSKHMVQLCSYRGGNDIGKHLEIDSHVGSVNDLAFANPMKQLSIITCGDDKTIKVWDALTGIKQYTFEGHEAPVYSVCPHSKGNIHFLFSTSLDGKIKAWLYDMMGSKVDYDTPGRGCTTMAYSSDGKRLFSCGTSEAGETHIVEWNDTEGVIKRTYQGFCEHSLGVVQFDITKNRFLAAGDDYLIKFWDMDNVNLLTSINVEGALPASPRIRFNREGTLLAVSANDNRIKILASVDALQMLNTNESHSFTTSRMAAENAPEHAISPISAVASAISAEENGDTRSLENVTPRLTEINMMKIWKPTEINGPAQFRSLRLPVPVKTDKILRLIYTNSGTAILALASNATHLLWKWPHTELNLNGKATTKDPPQFYQTGSGIPMTNDLTNARPKEAVPCFALSKNDSYLISASGGKICLFNTVIFKTMTTFLHPPPAATSLVFLADNNIIAVGMDDSTIQIFNVREDKVISKLNGHSKRITSLAFSSVLKFLVSSGADAEIIVWNSNGWKKEKSIFLQIPADRTPTALSDTSIQFRLDHTHFLAVHETQLAIYEMTKLQCVNKWVVGESSVQISHATFSCDCQLVYAGFLDGTLFIFDASTLQLQCQIKPTAYIPSNFSSRVYPLVIAAHPQERNQFAVGLTDGGVLVFEPLDSEGKWGDRGDPNWLRMGY